MTGLQQRFKRVVDHFEVDLGQFAFFHGSTPYKTRFYLSTLGQGTVHRPPVTGLSANDPLANRLLGPPQFFFCFANDLSSSAPNHLSFRVKVFRIFAKIFNSLCEA